MISDCRSVVLSALIFIGALSACSPTTTPIPVATLTLIPSTATATPPSTTEAFATSTQEATPTIIPSPSVSTILALSITPDVDLTNRIIQHLAQQFSIDTNRIQIVTIETAIWFDAQLGCSTQPEQTLESAIATFQPTQRTIGLRYLLLIGDTIHEYHTNSNDQFLQCESVSRLSGDVLLAVDPVARDILGLVQRRVAEMLDLTTRRVFLQTIEAYTWTDTSVGCPQADQVYTAAEIPGYRILVTAGTDNYLFHSDAVQIFLCDINNEVLPP